MQTQKLIKRKKKALSEGNKTLLASTCIDLADLYVEKGSYDEAIDEYLIVADVYKDMGKLLDFARANRMIGEAYTNLSKYDKALSYQQIYLNIAKEQKDKIEEQRALATIGNTYLTTYLAIVDNPDKSSLKLAQKSFMKSLVVCESLAKVINKREHKDMTARLLANLGIIEECQNNFEKGVELLQKSITICKEYDLYEQLERSHNLLGTLYDKTNEYDKALHQYNLAIEVAGRLKNKVNLTCLILSAKADILIKLADFRGAKTVLFKAYKLNSPILSEKQNIEHNLKVVAAMCYAEDSLLTVNDSDHAKKRDLYEKLGDGACSLKKFSKAIEYYHKMLEAAKNNHESGAQLSPCYISLAETYRDNKQYDLATYYFKEEYNCLKGRENISTLLNIMDCLEKAGRSINEITIYFTEARKECVKLGDKKLEYRVLSKYITLLRKHNVSEADTFEDELRKISLVNCFGSDSEVSEDQNTPNIGDDISISDITDISDDSDTENIKSRSTRKRTKGLVVKRNNKGETQLHTACINGNAVLVKHLLDQGHPVNARDNCGWLPIHEACICGHVDIVNMLIDKGANINDRGGTLCNGTTPLHDAATNGHLQVIQLLLNKNACTTSKNDLGEIPLQILKKWRQGHDTLSEEDQRLYNNLTKRLEEDADKLGHNKNIIKESHNYAFETNSERDIQQTSPVKQETNRSPGLKPTVGSLRRNISFDKDIDSSDEENYSSNEQTNITSTYKEVMESLKHPHRDVVIEKKRKSGDNRKSAHIESDIGETWLENDIDSGRQKKRKLASDSLITTTSTRRTSAGSLSRHSSASIKSKNSFSEDVESANEFIEPQPNLNVFDCISIKDDIENFAIDSDDDLQFSNKPKSTSCNQESGTKYRSLTCNSGNKLSLSKPKQTKLTHFGHTRSVMEFERKSISSTIVNDTQCSSIVNSLYQNEPMLSIDVDVDGKLYRVPVPASEIHSRTIKWLADEAAKRYGRKESLKPTVELETKNGASLADDDVVSILFTPGSSRAEEVLARILNWNLPPLLDRYREACAVTQIECNEKIEKILLESSTVLNLSNLGVKSSILGPFCKAINRQSSLHSLHLSGNIIQHNTMQLLCSSLPSLDNLNTLDLSLNKLALVSLECLADLFTQASKPILPDLVNLDLSYNPLGDESFKCLAIITRFLKLQTLNLISVDFTSDIFNVISNKNVELCMDYIIEFNISYNSLNKDDIVKLLSWINPQKIEVLNISNNLNLEEGFAKEVVNWLRQALETYSLKSLDMSRCNVQDVEVYELLNILSSTSKLNSLNLSYNSNLTSLSLRRFMQQSSIVELDLIGCKNIFKYFGDCSDNTWTINRLKQMKLSFDFEKNFNEKSMLVNSWKNHYGEKAGIKEDLLGYLELYIIK